MIKKRILTDLFIRGIKFVDKETQKVIDLSSAEDLKLFVRRQSSVSMTWTEQTFELTSDGLVSFQWNAKENVKLGIFDAMISYHKTSALSETGTIEYKYDVTDLFRIVPISEDEENVDGIVTVSAVYYGGSDGLSAYEIAVKDGYVGTEAEWIKSLALTYDELTDEQIENLKKPATDAAKIAENAANVANEAAKSAESSATLANQVASHPNVVGSNGNWWAWDVSLSAYKDTGVASVGVIDIEIADDAVNGNIEISYPDGVVNFSEDKDGDIVITY